MEYLFHVLVDVPSTQISPVLDQGNYPGKKGKCLLLFNELKNTFVTEILQMKPLVGSNSNRND